MINVYVYNNIILNSILIHSILSYVILNACTRIPEKHVSQVYILCFYSIMLLVLHAHSVYVWMCMATDQYESGDFSN